MPYTYLSFTMRDNMLFALSEYAFNGRPVGDFLRHVISNDLMGAVGHADADNMRNLPAFTAWLYNEAPALCHGSRERYDAWLNVHESKRTDEIKRMNGSRP
jgi:hypothetical protein